MTKGDSFKVIKDHTSEFPDPITFSKGDELSVGERYDGPEDWTDWYWCHTVDGAMGWVPLQVLELIGANRAVAREDYTARELSVQAGETVIGTTRVNGWIWCEHADRHVSGWVPVSHLQRTT